MTNLHGKSWLGIGLFLFSLGVFVWTAYEVASRALVFWQAKSTDTRSSDRAISSATNVDYSYDIPRIVSAHLFGAPREQTEPDMVEAPETKLQVDLLGLIASGNENLSRAIIAVNGSSMKPYSVGQSVEGTDASVHAVESRRVLLKRRDAIESLSLKRKGITQGISSDSRTLIKSGAERVSFPPTAENRQTNAAHRRSREIQTKKLPF